MDDFVRFRLGGPWAKACGHIYLHGFCEESGAGVEVENEPPMGGGVSGLLQEFALGRVQSFFPRIDAPRREFPQKAVGRVAILALKQNTRRRARLVDGQYNNRTAVMNDIATCADASRLPHIVRGHPEDRATIRGARGDQPSLGI